MKNKNERFFLKIMGAPEVVNNIVNRAYLICSECNCSTMNGVHLFLATLQSIKDIDELLNSIGVEYNVLHSSYEYLAGCGDYGELRGDGSPNQVMNDYIGEIISYVAINKKKGSITELFLKGLNENKDADLKKYLDYVELDIEDILKNMKSTFAIPDEISEFITDYNEKVRSKNEKIGCVDEYVDKMINVLCRKNKKNPCLVGEAGVGKTTIVEALVQRINSGNVPSYIKDKKVLGVNSNAMLSGTRYRGDFEERLSSLMNFASNNKDVILFVDEIHQFMNLGGSNDESQSVGNSLKDYLNSGDICLIGTTTNSEWHKHIEKDLSLKRRLQEINVNEPTVENAIKMISQSITNFEEFHALKIDKMAIESAVKLSDRYMKLEKLPDKAVKIIDQACASAKIAGKKYIGENDIVRVIHELTGVEVDKISKTDIDKLRNLEANIHKQLIGQNDAVNKVVKAIKRGKTGVRDINKPVASFLFVGPTGVGKTELCKIISKEVYNNKESFIRIDMSEYSEKYSTSKLIGSAPGYVGYGDGGNLTEKVKKNPNSLILLDEIEKADKQVFDTFLQVLDDGVLTDSEGQTVDFKNSIIVMTSNAGYGADFLNKKTLGFNNVQNNDENKREEIVVKALEETFRPEFINRIDNIVVFDKLTKEQCNDVTKLLLNNLSSRLKEKNIEVKFNNSLVNFITDKGYSEKYGARNIKRQIQDYVEDVIADKIIYGELKDGSKATVSYKGKQVCVEVK